MITNAFYAFYDLHRPAYHAYAAAYLPPEEARIAVTHIFALVADHWSTIISQRYPSAWAWERYTRTIARRSGRTPTATEDVHLLYEQLFLSIDQIATVTGVEPAAVTALLAAAHRSASQGRRPQKSPGRCTADSRHCGGAGSRHGGVVSPRTGS